MWFDPQTLLARSYPPATSATSATFEVQAGTKVAESQESQGVLVGNVLFRQDQTTWCSTFHENFARTPSTTVPESFSNR